MDSLEILKNKVSKLELILNKYINDNNNRSTELENKIRQLEDENNNLKLELQSKNDQISNLIQKDILLGGIIQHCL